MKRFPPRLFSLGSSFLLAFTASSAEIGDIPVGQDQEEVLIISDREKVELVEDSNLEEAMSRRPDLSFRNVTIDGEVATISLKDIQADSVEAAEVSKAVTPDLDADLRGGGLNLRSKPTYGLAKRVLKASLDSRYDPVLKSWDKEGSLSYGRSMGRWGFMFTGSAENGPYALETYNQDWIRLPSPEGERFVLKEQRFQHSRTAETEFKANGTVDFRLGDSVRLYFKGDYRDSNREAYRPRLYVRYNKGKYDNITDGGADVNGAHIERLVTSWKTDSSEYTMTTGGYLDFDTVSIDYQLSFNDSGLLIPELLSTLFRRRGMDLAYDFENTYLPAFSLQDSSAADIYAAESYKSEWFSSNRWETGSRVWLSTANVKVPLRNSWFKGYIKSGFKLRGLDYEKDIWDEHYDSFNSKLTLDMVESEYDLSHTLGGQFNQGPNADNVATSHYFSEHPEEFRYNETRTREDSDPESYATGQDIYSGYGMVYFNLKELRIIAGLRYEQTNLDYLANEVILDENGTYLETKPVTDSNRYGNWFPGIHGRYDIGRVSFIGSWSNTISRPEFALTVPYREVHRESEFIETGNPGLKPTLYANYDLAVDYRLNGGDDLLSMELFYQTVEDIIYNEISIVQQGPYTGYELESMKNGPKGDIHGVRLIWSQNLGKWLTFAEGLRFNARYTHRISETIYPGRPDEILPMPRRPRNSVQLNISFKRKRLFAQLEIDYFEASLHEINDEAVWRDIYQGSGTRMDFSSSYQLGDGVRFLFEIANLTGKRRGEDYYGEEILLSGYVHSPRRYRVGLKFDL